MSTHKNIEKICVAAIAFAVILCIVFMNGAALGIQSMTRTMGYETTLFDTSKVHQIDIEIEDWDGFLADCENEEYVLCNVVIDNEAEKNVGIRAKGNTSLRNVSELNSLRYSFKIEFDHYDSNKNYKGLDKLSLNNIIQDNTYMKDYLSYQLMNAYGVDAPLCSYAWITVNGEDWGLYLAVEGIEDSFLEREYGSEQGNLYKPDSMSQGGGRGNGKDFDMDDFENANAENQNQDTQNNGDQKSTESQNGQMPQMSNQNENGGQSQPQMSNQSGNNGQTQPQMPNQSGDNGQTLPQMPDQTQNGGQMPQMPNQSGENGRSVPQMPENMEMPEDMGEMPDFSGDFPQFGGGSGGGGMNDDDVKLRYIDDNISSYSNIFSNAKGDVTQKGKNRLIASLKSLSNNENIEDVVNVDEVMRYFVVHNYLVNGDSYTGSMVHNYYLYENNGQLSMIPWDYNLAFGGFQGGDAGSSVNDAIDTPLSVSESDDRPMFTWITKNENYLEQYHEYFADFLNNVDIQKIIDDAYVLISDYVEKDPTKFCTTEEFKTGVSTLKSFCKLRTQSIQGQLNGTIPSTDEGQTADSTKLVDASSIQLSDMGSMNSGKGGFGEQGQPGQQGPSGGNADSPQK